MARDDLRLDSDGIEKVLKSGEMKAEIRSRAQSIASSARGKTDAPIEVEDQVTDRAVSVVVVKHAKAQAEVALKGLLISDAAGVGLEVTER